MSLSESHLSLVPISLIRIKNGELVTHKSPENNGSSDLLHPESIMEYNGGSVIAMAGKDCVAIASDLRLGTQSLGISSNFQKVCHVVHFLLQCMSYHLVRYSL